MALTLSFAAAALRVRRRVTAQLAVVVVVLLALGMASAPAARATPAPEPSPAAEPSPDTGGDAVPTPATVTEAPAPTPTPAPGSATIPEPAPPAAASTWTAARPGVWGMGDSLFSECGDDLGVGSRSLGMVGWWGGTTWDMRRRMATTSGDWPFVTEASHAAELQHFREAGTWLMGLGTNDVRLLTAAQYRANVDWFMQQSRGRPVLWYDIHNPQFPEQAARFNTVLRDAALRWPNLRVLDWHRFAAARPHVLRHDQVHIRTFREGCVEGRFRLAQEALPVVPGTTPEAPPGPVEPPVPSPIAVRYAASGGSSGPLGAAKSAEVCGMKAHGCRQSFARGDVYWSPATGARLVSQAGIRAKWLGDLAEMGPLGYPRADPVCGLRAGGCRQVFETGSIYWSPGSGARLIVGPTANKWSALGAENGGLGFPTSDTLCGIRDNGCYQLFEKGSIHWSVPSGAHPVIGAIGRRWAGWESERGRLGYPTTDERCGLRSAGCFQFFQGGAVYWVRGAGAHVVYGAVYDRWAAQGWENGLLGYPTTSPDCRLRGGGCFQFFQGGAVYWSHGTGAHVVYGALYDRWAAQGWENGLLGYPTTSPDCRLRGGGCFQFFQGGAVYWSPGTGARIVRGAIFQRWAGQGWETGRLGYPTTDERCGLRGGGCFQFFQGGSIYWSPRTGAHPVTGRIYERWAAQGWERGRLGYPTGEARAVRGPLTQRFQGGTLTG